MKSMASAAALLGLLVAFPAQAYRLDEDGNGHPLHWKSMPVRYLIATAGLPGGSAGEDAVKRSFQSWSDASANVSYSFGGTISSGSSAYDRRNVVYWVASGWPYDRTALAVTSRYFSKSDGSLLDADIVFNGQHYPWSVGGSGYDVENAAAHEVGHFGGLGHSSSSSATMSAGAYPGETQKRTLSSDDREGLEALYGGVSSSGGSSNSGGVVSSASGVQSSSGGGCAIGSARRADSSNPGELIWVAALLCGLWLRARRGTDLVSGRFPAAPFGGAIRAHSEARGLAGSAAAR